MSSHIDFLSKRFKYKVSVENKIHDLELEIIHKQSTDVFITFIKGENSNENATRIKIVEKT